MFYVHLCILKILIIIVCKMFYVHLYILCKQYYNNNNIRLQKIKNFMEAFLLNLLITNDDGINAEGIQSLIAALTKENNVLVVAPDTERSGSGHSTSLKNAIKYKKIDMGNNVECYSVSGTPVDCIKFGISFLAKTKIDLIVSGINHGRNLGTDVIYSGTVGAALEAIICGYSAVAVSYSGLSDYHFDFAAEFIAKNLDKFKKLSSKQNVININFPKCKPSEIKGIKITPLGREKYQDKYKIFSEGNEEEGYVLQYLPHLKVENPENCDILLNVNKYLTITPLNIDLTDYQAISKIEEKDFIL